MAIFVGSQSEVRAQLDQPWERARFVVADFETTGLSATDAIISFGAVHIDGARVVGRSSVYGLVRPPVPPSPESIRVHAIRPGDLESAPSLPGALDPLFAAMTGRVLVAHAAWVERGFLDRALLAREVAVDLTVVDTAELSWAHFELPRDPRRSPGLETVAGRLALPVFTPHHALGDAWTTALVFLALARHRAAGRAMSVRELVAASDPAHRGGVAVKRSWRGRKAAGADQP